MEIHDDGGMENPRVQKSPVQIQVQHALGLRAKGQVIRKSGDSIRILLSTPTMFGGRGKRKRLVWDWSASIPQGGEARIQAYRWPKKNTHPLRFYGFENG